MNNYLVMSEEMLKETVGGSLLLAIVAALAGIGLILLALNNYFRSNYTSINSPFIPFTPVLV